MIPIVGPLLRETMTTITSSEWKYLGDGWDWDMKPYAGGEVELQRLRKMLVYPLTYDGPAARRVPWRAGEVNHRSTPRWT